jgi:hypothetical protein
MKAIARLILRVAFIIGFSGCIHSGENMYMEITNRPPSEWSEPDAFDLIVASMSNNFIDPRQIEVKVNATGYFPMTILAIQRESQLKNHWSEGILHEKTDQLLMASCGVYYEWSSRRFVDTHGNYIKNPIQYEAMEFMVTIFNLQYPRCFYDIRDLNERIILSNDHGDQVRPLYVWGKKNDNLINTETLIVKFLFRKPDGHHFLEKCREMVLEVRGFEATPIRLSFPVSYFQ